ncbi:iron chaperone [Simiduia agarivorans]|uniref:YdhG-like domain-containing protein n=1 Tax=Simiduia agarivorans (strain DSM 21679 / JCM 13881 / BCRC 17597 / SA1) TaxID=1117647 RepID=K4L170_SIMAS|nr:DUF1801 domain-containing protein [Simiduia agarivorans]AFU99918.1 hypothetical protein M5M_13900 [Simiduia agarivorans SA1 = DSM 21679]AFU99922.1 hypothetical protein M5M_13920 [Simiduia agarivorans SA1 = DSM 21679]
METPSNHEEYIANAPEELRPLLVNLRARVSHVLSDAEEIIAYNMPGFKMGKAIIVGYAAFSKQCGIYVAPGAISSLADEISKAGLKATKTGVTFSPKKPIPDELVENLTKASKSENGF